VPGGLGQDNAIERTPDIMRSCIPRHQDARGVELAQTVIQPLARSKPTSIRPQGFAATGCVGRLPFAPACSPGYSKRTSQPGTASVLIRPVALRATIAMAKGTCGANS